MPRHITRASRGPNAPFGVASGRAAARCAKRSDLARVNVKPSPDSRETSPHDLHQREAPREPRQHEKSRLGLGGPSASRTRSTSRVTTTTSLTRAPLAATTSASTEIPSARSPRRPPRAHVRRFLERAHAEARGTGAVEVLLYSEQGFAIARDQNERCPEASQSHAAPQSNGGAKSAASRSRSAPPSPLPLHLGAGIGARGNRGRRPFSAHLRARRRPRRREGESRVGGGCAALLRGSTHRMSGSSCRAGRRVGHRDSLAVVTLATAAHELCFIRDADGPARPAEREELRSSHPLARRT